MTTRITSISTIIALAASVVCQAKSTMDITTPDTVEDWAASTLWSDGVPTIDVEANVTSTSANLGVLQISDGTQAKALNFGVDDYATLKILSGGSLELAAGKELYIGNNAKVIIDGGTLTSSSIAVNYGSFTVNAGSVINGNFRYSSKSVINVTGSTVNAAGSNFFSNNGGSEGDVATSTYDSSTVNGAGGSIFFLGGAAAKSVFNFNNKSVLNAYSEGGLDADGFVTDSSQNVRVGWNSGDSLDAEINVSGGSALYTGAFNIIDGDGASLTSVKAVVNMSGGEGNVSKISTTNAVFGLAKTDGASLEAGLSMKGHSDFKSNGGLTIGANGDAAAGRAYVEVTGTNNTITAKGNLGVAKANNATGGTAELLVSGSDNSVFVGSNIEMGGYAQDGLTGKISIVGANNLLQVSGSTTVGWGDQLASGFNTIYAKGADADNKAYLKLDGALNIWGSTVASSTGVNEVILDGNVDYRRINPGNWATVNVGTQAAQAGGTTRFVVRGSGNFAGLWNLTLGNADQTGGKSVLRIEGAGSEINVNGSLSVIAGASAGVGGVVEFVLADDGVSKLFAGTVSNFTGILSLDFTMMTMAYEEGQTFDLISSNNSLKAFYDALLAEKRVETALRFGDASDAAELLLSDDEKTISVKYTSSVPEPGAYAALLGIAALAFALRRRRA